MTLRTLVVLFMLAVSVRATVVINYSWIDFQRTILVEPDSARYFLLADQLLSGQGFTKPSEDGLVHQAVERVRQSNGTLPAADDRGNRAEVFRTPVYPVMLAAFGGTPGWKWVLLAQALGGGLSTLFLMRIAIGLDLGRRAALIAGILYALHPAIIIFDAVPLTESLFNLLALAALALAARSNAVWQVALAGVLLGLCGLTRPLGLVFLPLMYAVLVSKPTRFRDMAVVTLLGVLPTVGWSLRNEANGNGFRVTTVSDINSYYYGAAYVRMEQKGQDWARDWPAMVQQLTGELQDKSEPGQDVFRRMRQLAVQTFRDDPKTTVMVGLKSQFKLIVDHSVRNYVLLSGEEYKPTGLQSSLLGGKTPDGQQASLGPPAIAALGWSLFNGLIAIAAIGGTLRALRRRHYRLLFGVVLVALLFSAATFPVGLERFRIPMIPLLLLLAGYALRPPPLQPTV
ncbi:MAG: hypothetical protein ACRCZF_25425 [Gemmataceae bacterium]